MNDRFRAIQFFAFGLAVRFYTAFVAQMLWNWFATEAFRVGALTFWQMFGLVLIWDLFAGLYASEEVRDHRRWNRVFITLDTLIPVETKRQVALLIAPESDEARQSLGISLARGFLATQCLVLGWLVHAWLS